MVADRAWPAWVAKGDSVMGLPPLSGENGIDITLQVAVVLASTPAHHPSRPPRSDLEWDGRFCIIVYMPGFTALGPTDRDKQQACFAVQSSADILHGDH